MLLKLAVKYLCYCLRKDKSLWYCYQSNIAMVIYDNYGRYFPLTTEKRSPTLLEFCNICADDFLKIWVKSQKERRKNNG